MNKRGKREWLCLDFWYGEVGGSYTVLCAVIVVSSVSITQNITDGLKRGGSEVLHSYTNPWRKRGRRREVGMEDKRRGGCQGKGVKRDLGKRMR